MTTIITADNVVLDNQTSAPSPTSDAVTLYAKKGTDPGHPTDPQPTDPNGNVFYVDSNGNESAVAARSIQTLDPTQYFDPSSDSDDTNSIQRAHDAGDHTGSDFAIYLKNRPGGWTVSDELSLQSQWLRAIYGDGIDVTTIQAAFGIGCTKKLFNLDVPTSSETNRYKIQLYDFTIMGNTDPADPIGIYRSWVTTSRWRIKVVNLWNIAVFCEEVDNSEFDLELTGCGYQPLVMTPFTSAVNVMTTANSTTLTATGTFSFTSDMVNKWILVARGDTAVAAADGTWALRKITAVSGLTCTVDQPFTNAATSPMSWYRPTGSIDLTSPTKLVPSDSVLSSSDVGRPIWICGAGLGGGVLLTTIMEPDEVGVINLADAASNAVTDAEWFIGTPLAIGQFVSPEGNDSGVTNDLRIRGRIENYHGPAMILHNCHNVRISNIKTHGLEQDQNNIGYSAYASVQPRCTSNIFDSTCMHDKIYTNGRPIGDAANGGCHLVLGTEGFLTFHGLYAPIPDYAFLVDCRLTDSDAEIHLGGGGGKPANQPWAKRISGLTRSAIKFDSPIIASGFDALYRTFAGVGPANATISNNTIKILDPDMATGYLQFTSTAVSSSTPHIPVCWARGMFICGSSPNIADLNYGGNTTVANATIASTAVTTSYGPTGNLYILNCTDGKIALLNLFGSSISLHINREAYG